MKSFLNLLKLNKKSKKGVSLITLVITIVVIIILATIAISGNMGTVTDAELADYRHELKTVEVSVASVRIGNQQNGIGEEYKEVGFYPIIIENPPKNFESFTNGELHDFNDGEFYGYIVDLKTAKEDSVKRGKDYKKYTDYEANKEKVLTFGERGKDNDVYVYDATGKMFYAKGIYADGGVYYSDELTQDGPIVNIEKKPDSNDEHVTKVELIIEVIPVVSDSNMRVKLNGEVLNKEEDGKYRYMATKNGTYIVEAEEDTERVSKKRVAVSEIEERDYIITYYFDDGIHDNQTQIKNGSKPIRLNPPEKVTREGYILKGWSLTLGGTEVDYKSGSYYTDNADLKLYAVWEKGKAKEYTITFNANGGSRAPDSIIKEEGVVAYIPLETPIRSGYIFLRMGRR